MIDIQPILNLQQRQEEAASRTNRMEKIARMPKRNPRAMKAMKKTKARTGTTIPKEKKKEKIGTTIGTEIVRVKPPQEEKFLEISRNLKKFHFSL